MLVHLSGCASATDSYCATLEDERQVLTGLAATSDQPGADLFENTLAVFETLRGEAPGDVRDEWDTFLFAWQDVADAFSVTRVRPGDYAPGTTPPGLNREAARRIENAAAELRSVRVVEAGRGIEQHARDVCKVDLAPATAGS